MHSCCRKVTSTKVKIQQNLNISKSPVAQIKLVASHMQVVGMVALFPLKWHVAPLVFSAEAP